MCALLSDETRVGVPEPGEVAGALVGPPVGIGAVVGLCDVGPRPGALVGPPPGVLVRGAPAEDDDPDRGLVAPAVGPADPPDEVEFAGPPAGLPDVASDRPGVLAP